MPSPEELTAELKIVFDYMRARECQWLSVRDVRIPLGLTNGAARFRLSRLATLGLIKTYLRRVSYRRRWFHYVLVPYTGEELSPSLKLVFDWLKARESQRFTVRDIRLALGLTNGAARWRLTTLARMGYLQTYVRRVTYRRRWYHYVKVIPLCRIKIRLYTEERKPTPEGAFQGWFDIDARLDPETGLVDWTYWLTQELIEIAKYHFIGYWKGLANWRGPEQIGLAYFFEKELAEKGIHAPEKGVSYPEPTRAYITKAGIPEEYMRRAERLKVKDVIIGESSVAPRPIKNIDEEGGVFFQQVMLIIDSAVKWQQRLDYYSWKLTSAPTWLEKVKSELGIK